MEAIVNPSTGPSRGLVEQVLSERSLADPAEVNLTEPQKQRLRLRFFIVGGLFALMAWSSLMYAELNGLANPGAAIYVLTGFAVSQVILTAFFLTGANRRFAEKSLTIAQLYAYILLETLAIATAPQLRHSFAMLYCLSLTFGVFRLRASQARWLAASVAALYVATVALLWRLDEIPRNFPREAIAFSGLALFLVCYCIMVDYVNRLRTRANAADASYSLEAVGYDASNQRQWSRVVEYPLLQRALKNCDILAQAGRLQYALIQFSVEGFDRIAGEVGAAAAETLQKHVAERLRSCIPHGALVSSAGSGRILVLMGSAKFAHVRELVKTVMQTESSQVLLLPGAAQAIAVRLSAQIDSY
jgi:hypothetical protein